MGEKTRCVWVYLFSGSGISLLGHSQARLSHVGAHLYAPNLKTRGEGAALETLIWYA